MSRRRPAGQSFTSYAAATRIELAGRPCDRHRLRTSIEGRHRRCPWHLLRSPARTSRAGSAGAASRPGARDGPGRETNARGYAWRR
jgi:hypothetical protein